MKSGRESDKRPVTTRATLFFAASALAGGLIVAVALPAPAALAQGAQPSSQPAAQQTAQQRRAAQKKTKTPLAQTAPKPADAARPAAPKREPKGFVETIMEGPRLTTTPPEAADWVRQTRRDPNAARPAGPTGPSRPLLTPDEIRAREAALDSARARHDKIAGRKPPTGKLGSAAGKPEPAEPEKAKPGCVLTCATPIGVPQTQRR